MNEMRPDYFMLLGEQDLSSRAIRLSYDTTRRALMLTRNDRLRLPPTDRAAARDLVAGQRPVLCDINRQLAWIDRSGRRLLMGQVLDDEQGQAVRASNADAVAVSGEALELAPVEAEAGAQFVDLAMWERWILLAWTNGDDRHGLSVVELGTKRHYRFGLDARPLRVWLDRQRRIWVVDDTGRLLRCEGEPLPQAWTPRPDVFRPFVANPHAPRVRQQIPLPEGLSVLAMCADAERLYLLGEDEILVLRLEPPFDDWQRFTLEPAWPSATDCRVLSPGRLALWVPVTAGGVRTPQDCLILQLDEETGLARQVMERYPRRTPLHNAFLANPESSALYLSGEGVLKLTGLPQQRFFHNGAGILGNRLDCRIEGTLWHRISFEACIPQGTTVRIQLRAYDHPSQRGQRTWHDQGEPVSIPYSVWRSAHPQARFWDLLIRKGADQGAVREIRGRFLEIKVRLTGNGMASPMLFALRVWSPRLSWQQRYLPEFMHQDEEPTEDQRGLANGADVRERMLGAFEGVLTPIAQRIRDAQTLIDPLTAPEPLLPRLGAMLGESPPTHWPSSRRRAWLAMAGDLQRWRGTIKGLCLALDIATDGAVTRGQLVPVEDFRLRRPLFCVLGVDFAAGGHPLTLGTVQSGNSIVGDTLELGPDDALALLLELLPEADSSSSTQELLKQFADRHAYRISIVLHASASRFRGVIDEVLELELPAHLSVKFIETDRSFVPGLAPLLGIHTFLEQFPAWRRMVLDRDRIGGAAVLSNLPVLTPGRRIGPQLHGESS